MGAPVALGHLGDIAAELLVVMHVHHRVRGVLDHLQSLGLDIMA